ncbi:YheC/YheD family endospore coat-associated protein [Paenibacillus tarimensis]|uniref:YheC/YheD family endospore coat-associated protein n=1 Tax=Paenibacillus tarimensis TaxID=416012 RepID=UPI001F38B73C|nr:YheC/YheD family protein [Paenibacillus tarimensis]MCF2943875.1 YheC/YheD family protein [Paenibacillus tarimensis]
MTNPVLGILTLYLNEKRTLEERPIYQRMTTAAKNLGIDVMVFTPEDVNYKLDRIHALIYNPDLKRWSRKWTSFPHIIFDRCRIQKSKRFERLKYFRAKYGNRLFLNRPMRNKWSVYRTLSQDSRFRPHLPETRLYHSSRDLTEMLHKYPLLYLKPFNGTGGRGILRIQKDNGRLLIQGRDLSRRIIRPQRVLPRALLGRLSSWSLKERNYLVQQGIQLKLDNGRVHDYRMLVQKNGNGVWEVTGCAGRVGAAGSVTSNLHGGGRAERMDDLLRQWIGNEAQVIRIKQQADALGLAVARFLEETYGALCELALDIAIDRNGHIWLLEVNPKPAREVFARIGEKETYHKAIVRPLEYAMWVYSQRSRSKGLKSRTSKRPSQTRPHHGRPRSG